MLLLPTMYVTNVITTLTHHTVVYSTVLRVDMIRVLGAVTMGDILSIIYTQTLSFFFLGISICSISHFITISKPPLFALSNLSVSLHSANTTHLQRHDCNRPIVKKFKMQFQKVYGQTRVLQCYPLRRQDRIS